MSETPAHVSRPPARELSDGDVLFFCALAFVFVALAVTIAVRLP